MKKAEPLKDKLVEEETEGRYPITFIPEHFKPEDVKSVVGWLREWKLYSTGYPYKQKCDCCKKKFAIWYSKGKEYLCQTCLYDKAFEDVTKENSSC